MRADALSDELGPSGAPVEFVQLTPKATDGTVPLLGVLEALAQVMRDIIPRCVIIAGYRHI